MFLNRPLIKTKSLFLWKLLLLKMKFILNSAGNNYNRVFYFIGLLTYKKGRTFSKCTEGNKILVNETF